MGLAAMRIRPFKLLQFFHGALHLSSSQLPVRICMLLLAFLMTLAGFFGIDAILGAFSAEFDVGAIAGSLTSMLLIPMFLILLLIVWGVPVMLYRKDLTKEERLPFALYLATALPLVVAITDIGVHTGVCVRRLQLR